MSDDPRQGELFEREEPEQASGVSYLVPLGQPVHVPWPGVWRVERTPSGGHLVTLISESEQ